MIPSARPIGWYALAWPVLRRLDPEDAHRLALRALALGLMPPVRRPTLPRLATTRLGLHFSQPVGLAAGFDKNAVAIAGLARLGFGFLELGGVTPRPQPGNPRPRLFRLDEDLAAINRMGFNNDGAAAVAARLAAATHRLPLGVNLASNTDSPRPLDDFIALAARFAPCADYLTIDVSCPNTRNGRMFQAPGPLAELLDALVAVTGARRPPMLVKLAADLTEAEALAIAQVTVAKGLEGLVVANTSAARPAGLISAKAAERGGLSGRPVFAAATALLAAIRRQVGPAPTLVGVGGVFDGRDAYAKIRAGANLVQLYTALVFRGPAVAVAIARELDRLLAADGFAGVEAAVGADL